MSTSNPSNAMPTGPGGIPLVLWNLPALAPPEGKIPNFDHPESRGMELIAINSVFLALTLIAVSMCFLARRGHKNGIGLDGYTCIIATLACICHSGLMPTSEWIYVSDGTRTESHQAWKTDMEGISRRSVPLRLYTPECLMNLLSCIYIIAICFAKLSVLLLYYRFFKVITLTRQLIAYGLVFTIVASLAFLGIEITNAKRCVAPSSVLDHFCVKVGTIVVAQAAVNVFLDFYILLIPLQQVYRLRLDTRRKLSVASVFGVGLIACIVSVVRLGWAIRNLNEKDIFWASILTSEMSIAELNAVIIALCLVFLPAFIKSRKRGISSLRTRFASSRSQTDKPNLRPTETRLDYLEITERRSVELEFVTIPEDLSAPWRPPQAHVAGVTDPPSRTLAGRI